MPVVGALVLSISSNGNGEGEVVASYDTDPSAADEGIGSSGSLSRPRDKHLFFLYSFLLLLIAECAFPHERTVRRVR